VSKKRNSQAGVQLDPKKNKQEGMDGRPSEVFAQVRERAYEIFAARGYQPGHADEDWLLAESQMLGRKVHKLVDSWSK
jgi:hypothetical protein